MKDKDTTLFELQNQVEQFREERGWNPLPRNLAISIAIEAAELLEHFQWDGYEEYMDKAQDKKNEIANELADVLIYCLQFAAKTDIDISHAIERKLMLNAKKYPARLFRDNIKASKNYWLVKT
ncbi:MAG: nucleotide pyrophosphohydrolase [Parcubacteria group bacterium Gr01-1014_66]|nr:MAG: nucleotide pyrophosphohydrolase [Parcubacteria group bacterium Gr01-1014_66]